MDINLPSELTNPRPSTAAGGDLLAQLRAAGTIEAEVIKVLKDSLLLSSRLGEILTRNTLNYKIGDRLYLRLDERGPTPVLKSSPAEPRPVSLEARVYPEIARLLPPERPVLAKVLRVVAQQAEVRLAQSVVKLPPQVTAKRGDLLRLARYDSRQQIEITPLQAKAIYKALIKQLVPVTRDNGRTSLVKLFDLLARAAGEIQPRLTATAETVRNKPPPPAQATARPQALPVPTASANADTPAPRATTAAPPKAQNSAPAASSTVDQRPFAQSGRGIIRSPVSATTAPDTRATGDRQPGTISTTSAKASPVPTVRGGPPGPEPAPVYTASAPRVQGRAPSTMPPKPPSAPPPPTGQLKSAPTSKPQRNLSVPAASVSPQVARPNSPATAMPLSAAPNPSYSKPPAAAGGILFERNLKAPGDRGEPAPLQKLMTRLLPRLPQFDAASLQRWFQAAKLIDTAGQQSSAPTDIMRILARLGDGDGFARELGKLLTVQARSSAETESQAARVPAELPVPQIREGLKLVEQSLVQNLLQRATIGLQQETQQPLAFNLALPLLEQNEIKPLYIDLAQRKRAQKQNEQCWDIRIRFEFAALGPVCCHIMLEGSAVAASFYSERTTTRADIDAALPELRRQLTDAGFDTGEFHSFSGGFKIDQSPLTAALGEALIDIEV